jgi:hypothetical protein
LNLDWFKTNCFPADENEQATNLVCTTSCGKRQKSYGLELPKHAQGSQEISVPTLTVLVEVKCKLPACLPIQNLGLEQFQGEALGAGAEKHFPILQETCQVKTVTEAEFDLQRTHDDTQAVIRSS